MTLSPPEPPRHSSNAAAIASALWDSADIAGAGVQYERALHENPADLEALHGMGRVRLAQNDLAAALLFLEQAHALALSFAGGGRDEWAQRIRRDLAWAYYRVERFDLAADHFARLPDEAGLAAHLRAMSDLSPYRLPVDVEEIALPFLGTDPLPIVAGVIGGQEYALVLDTGSREVVVDASLLRLHDLPDHGTHEAAFASGQRAPVGYTLLPSLWLGEVALREVPAEVMDIRRFAPQLSGLLGTAFLQRFHLLCDWEGQVLRLRPRRTDPFPAFAEMTEVPFLLLDGHLILAPARLNEQETMAYVASGMAGGAFTVPASTVRQAALGGSEGTIQGVGAAGATTVREVLARRLCLGGWCREDVEGLAGFFPEALEWRYGFRIGAIISHAFMKGRRWGLDFARMKMYLE